MTRKTVVVAGLCAAVAAGGAIAYRVTPVTTGRATVAVPPQVRVTAATVEPISRVRELPGTVEPVRVARLASPAEGPIVALSVREGDAVRAGERVVRIGRHRATSARLTSQHEDLKNAEAELARVKRLVAKGALAGESLDRARADHERALAQAESGEETAGDHDVRAPWNGVVSRVLVQDGNYVAPRTPLLELFDPRSLVVRIAVPEAFATRIATGRQARVALDAHPGLEVSARIVRVYPELDRRLRTRTAELVLDRPPAIAPGMFARVRLAIEEEEQAIVIPAGALVASGDGTRSVFVVSDGRAIRRTVELGIEDGGRAQVRSGVRPGELVVVAGHPKLRDGSAVRVSSEPPAGGQQQVSARSVRP